MTEAIVIAHVSCDVVPVREWSIRGDHVIDERFETHRQRFCMVVEEELEKHCHGNLHQEIQIFLCSHVQFL